MHASRQRSLVLALVVGPLVSVSSGGGPRDETEQEFMRRMQCVAESGPLGMPPIDHHPNAESTTEHEELTALGLHSLGPGILRTLREVGGKSESEGVAAYVQLIALYDYVVHRGTSVLQESEIDRNDPERLANAMDLLAEWRAPEAVPGLIAHLDLRREEGVVGPSSVEGLYPAVRALVAIGEPATCNLLLHLYCTYSSVAKESKEGMEARGLCTVATTEQDATRWLADYAVAQCAGGRESLIAWLRAFRMGTDRFGTPIPTLQGSEPERARLVEFCTTYASELAHRATDGLPCNPPFSLNVIRHEGHTDPPSREPKSSSTWPIIAGVVSAFVVCVLVCVVIRRR